ncbi:MAG: hypothetical protein KGM83_11380 [Betaproteobacteria bacterium]|nr:hypothetical protein [Betaproteobacteria bacterium]
MNFKNPGADKRHKPSMSRGVASIERTASQIAATGMLSTLELRRLAADMVD